MRILLVLDEIRFYQPDFIARFIEKTSDEIVGGVLVTGVPAKSDLEKYLIRHWYYLKLPEMIKLGFDKISLMIKDKICQKEKGGHFCSVRSVLDFYSIEYFEVKNDINQKEYLDKIRKTNPDVIFSSNSLLFKSELLRLPRKGCLNIHSALLPSYQGLWPVFQAYRNGEQYTGVSVHVMVEGIDKGAVLSQRKVPIRNGDTISRLYIQCFQLGTEVLLEALDKVRKNDLTPCSVVNSPSYYSFPTKEHWREFRQRNGRFR